MSKKKKNHNIFRSPQLAFEAIGIIWVAPDIRDFPANHEVKRQVVTFAHASRHCAGVEGCVLGVAWVARPMGAFSSPVPIIVFSSKGELDTICEGTNTK